MQRLTEASDETYSSPCARVRTHTNTHSTEVEDSIAPKTTKTHTNDALL